VRLYHCVSKGRCSGIGADLRLKFVTFRRLRSTRDVRPTASRPAVGPTQPPVQWVPGVKRGLGFMLTDHSPPSSAEVKKE
jgi:hypothetical protein